VSNEPTQRVDRDVSETGDIARAKPSGDPRSLAAAIIDLNVQMRNPPLQAMLSGASPDLR
jgi:hypothetical protein